MAMKYPLNVPGFENRQLVLDAGGFLSGAKLLIDGKPANKGPKRGQLLLRRNDGTEVIAQLKTTHFVDPIPQVIINDEIYIVAPPLKWYQWLWCGLPLAMIFMGGFLGGLFGAMALVLNSRIFRSNQNNLKKYTFTGLVSASAACVFLIGATLLNLAITRFIPDEPKLFTSQTGGFSIITPYALHESMQTADTQAGKIELYTFAAEKREEYVSVTYSDYPLDLINSIGADISLERARDGFISSIKGQLLSDRQISVNGYAGKEVVVKGTADINKSLLINARFYLVNNRLYQIITIVSEGKELSDKMTNFLQSFIILDK